MKALRTLQRDLAMDAGRKLLLLPLLSGWCGKPVVLEFQFGVSQASGICVLVSVSESQLRLQFDQSAGVGCECNIQLADEIELIKVQDFKEATESILGKRLASFTAEESAAFSINSIEKVINVRFRKGARLIIGAIASLVVERNQLN